MSNIGSAWQLNLYNQALTLCGERVLASLTENREPRRLLDQAWSDGTQDAVLTCLSEGLWQFACRSQMYTYSPSAEPLFGYSYAFNLPTDLLRTASVCTDEYYNVPLTQYEEEGGFWYADWQTLYIKYISSDPQFGLNTALWSQQFIEYLASYLAHKIVYRVTSDMKRWDRVEKIYEKNAKNARSKDAMEEPARFPPQGAWAGSRFGRYWKGAKGNGGSF